MLQVGFGVTAALLGLCFCLIWGLKWSLCAGHAILVAEGKVESVGSFGVDVALSCLFMFLLMTEGSS